jgi:predicted DNA-binding protein with PD1-like motif
MRSLWILFLIFGTGCACLKGPHTYTLRLKPGEEVRSSLESFTQEHHLKAGAIVSAVGSLTELSLRMANQKDITHKSGHFEVVSLSGTLSPEGSHLHLAASDEKGVTFGGHLGEGNIVYTTLEIVILEPENAIYHRVTDPKTTYKELSVEN